MSNAEKMVSEDLIRAILGSAAQGYFSKDHGDQLRAILDQPAQQGQGEPVALPARKSYEESFSVHGQGQIMGWNEYRDAMEKLGPLHTHADPAEASKWRNEAHRFNLEVERLSAVLLETQGRLEAQTEHNTQRHVELGMESMRVMGESTKLRAQLAERDGHLENALDVLKNVDDLDWTGQGVKSDIERMLSASAEPSAPNDCAICRDLGNQCIECEEGEFREWADRHFAAADYRKTDAGVFIQDWMRHAYSAWCARGALERQP